MELSEAIRDYLKWLEIQNKSPHTLATYGAALADFAVYMQNIDVDQVTIDDVVRWFILIKNLKNLKNNSLIPKASALYGFFRFCKEKGVSDLPYELIRMPKKEPPAASAREIFPIRRLEEAIQALRRHETNKNVLARDMAAISLLFDSGLRVGEGRSLNDGDMDYGRRVGLVNTEKALNSKHVRQFIWSEPTNELLLNWGAVKRNLTDNNAVFVSLERGKSLGQRLSVRSFQRIVKRAAQLIGLENITPRILRRTSAFYTVENGGELSDVQHKLGHRSIMSSQPYMEMWGSVLPARLQKFLPERKTDK